VERFLKTSRVSAEFWKILLTDKEKNVDDGDMEHVCIIVEDLDSTEIKVCISSCLCPNIPKED